MAVKGRAAPEVERVYTRARALCQQVGDTPQLFPVLRGLFLFYLNCGQRQTAEEPGGAAPAPGGDSATDARALLTGTGLVHSGGHWEMQRGTLSRPLPPTTSRSIASSPTSTASTSASLPELRGPGAVAARYPDRALAQSQEALMLAQEVAHPLSLVLAQVWLACLYQFRQEAQAAHDRAAGSIALAAQHV